MLMSELIQFMHVGTSDTHDGGGDFLLNLSEESLIDKVRGPGRNKLYGDLKGIDKDNAEAVYRRNADRRQRWYRATFKPIPQGIAKFWRVNFDRNGFLDFVDRRITLDTRSDWYAVFTANGYQTTRDQLSALVADLFVTGLDHLATGNPAIDDEPWNPDLIDATAEELATVVQHKQRFADRKPSDIYVDGDVLVVGTYRVQMPGQRSVPKTVSAFERKYTDQLIKVLCAECGIEVSLDSLREYGGDYLEDFDSARQAYYLAEGLRELMKDSSLDGEDEFQKIKDETYTGVRPTYRKHHASSYEKM